MWFFIRCVLFAVVFLQSHLAVPVLAASLQFQYPSSSQKLTAQADDVIIVQWVAPQYAALNLNLFCGSSFQNSIYNGGMQVQTGAWSVGSSTVDLGTANLDVTGSSMACKFWIGDNSITNGTAANDGLTGAYSTPFTIQSATTASQTHALSSIQADSNAIDTVQYSQQVSKGSNSLAIGIIFVIVLMVFLVPISIFAILCICYQRRKKHEADPNWKKAHHHFRNRTLLRSFKPRAKEPDTEMTAVARSSPGSQKSPGFDRYRDDPDAITPANPEQRPAPPPKDPGYTSRPSSQVPANAQRNSALRQSIRSNPPRQTSPLMKSNSPEPSGSRSATPPTQQQQQHHTSTISPPAAAIAAATTAAAAGSSSHPSHEDKEVAEDIPASMVATSGPISFYYHDTPPQNPSAPPSLHEVSGISRSRRDETAPPDLPIQNPSSGSGTAMAPKATPPQTSRQSSVSKASDSSRGAHEAEPLTKTVSNLEERNGSRTAAHDEGGDAPTVPLIVLHNTDS